MIALIATAAARIPVCSRAPIPPECGPPMSADAMANQWLCLGIMAASFLVFYLLHRWSAATMARRAKEIE